MSLATNDQQLGIRIPAAVADQLDHIARVRKVKRSVVVRWAIEEYVEHFFSSRRPLKGTIDREVDDARAADETPAAK